MEKQASQSPVAIIGIGCIFAKSHDQKAFLRLLTRGISGISDPPDSHQQLREYLDEDPKKPDHIYCNRGGFLPTVKFDPTEFSIPPNVIEATDTSQLLGLVTAKKALDDAGYGPNGKEFDRNKASVILGVTGTQELVIPLGARLGHPIWRRALENAGVPAQQADEVIERIGEDYVSWQENSFPGLLGNVVAGRIANRLDLGGTNCVVDAACASSMGAIHMALLELRSGRSNMVITGGVDTINDAFMHMCFSKTQILSATGDVRPFSKDADGTVLGEGIGLVVLKRLSDAEKDGDRIYAVIKGLGSSSDGKSQSIYAPRPEGQSKALRRAYAEANVDPTTVDLVEAHGTGTRVGDQVEFKSLCDVFGETSPNGNRCALGSVKSNIGHTKAAAGTAGLIKAALSIYHKVMPPTLKAEKVDPKLGVEHSPFYLNTRLRPWVAKDGMRRRAGVSAFGFGGSNFHAVLEEHNDQKQEPSWDGSVEIAAFSGPDAQTVINQINQWSQSVLDESTAYQIGKMAKKSRECFRNHHPMRLVMVIDLDEDAQRLKMLCEDAVNHISGKKADPRHQIFVGKGEPAGGLAFLFPGQGSQYVGMGRDLNCCFPESLIAFEQASRHLDDETSLDDFVYPRFNAKSDELESNLRQTQIAQPAIGAVSVAMLDVLSRFGIKPDATCGHSYGELVALHAAGWMKREDLWRLSVQRGRLMALAGGKKGDCGTMLAIQAPLAEIDQWVQSLDGDVVLANRNALDQGILSGSAAAIDAAENACREKGWRTVRLPVAAAFHSPLVADAQTPFDQCVQSVRFNPGPIQVMSNTLGGAYPLDPEQIKTTLSKQLACQVDFVSNIETLYAQGIRTFVEVGPKSVLTRLAGSVLKDKEVSVVALDQSAGRNSGIRDLATVMSQLAALGYSIDLHKWEKSQIGSRKARMAINLTGANIRSSKPKPKTQKTSLPKPTGKRLDHKNQRRTDKVEATKVPPRPKALQAITDNSPADSPMDQQDQSSVQHALATVQQGLASLQALQSQTVQAHQKFLDTQAAASRTLQQMIQGAQQLASGNVGEQLSPADTTTGGTQPVPAMPAQTLAPQNPLTESEPPPAPIVKEPAPDGHGPTAGSGSDGPVIQRAVLEKTTLEIVSSLTGYPEEMLAMEMDIESDLGIDSIKRVEILSALEERMPELPKVTPDLMGTLKTLGQICDYLSASDATTAGQPSAAPAPDVSTSSASTVGLQKVEAALVEIVSSLTGYPEEMLAMDMDIESDLGIDSIKRVEILSALEERMPELPKVTPDLMGTLKTLGQICDYLSASDATSAGQPSAAPELGTEDASGNQQEVKTALVEIVSSLTGYPEQMLAMEMDIESDLGIDSIKRVEILSALEERMPELPKVTPDLMGTLKTLGQICDYLSASDATTDGQPSAAPAPDVSTPSASVGLHKVEAALVEIVSSLTGYPEQMLAMEMDIESDLGIDSIKRVEILSALEERMPELPKVTPDLMGTLKTLGQICDYLNGSTLKTNDFPEAAVQSNIHVVPDREKQEIERQCIRVETLESCCGTRVQFEQDGFIGVVGGTQELGDELIAALSEQGVHARMLNRREELADEVALSGLVLMSPIKPAQAFQWAKAGAPLLKKTAQNAHACFVTVSALDGAFGFYGGKIDDPTQGALAGLVKTAAIEWPQVHCRAIDVDPRWNTTGTVAQALCEEILLYDDRSPNEIGIGPKGRVGLSLEPVAHEKVYPLRLEPQDVVVITGGARGVTAAAAQSLASQTPCTLVLMGRSPAPQQEPQWLRSLSDEGDIKKAIFSHSAKEDVSSPKAVEKVYRQWMANRQVLETLENLTQSGVKAHYISVDVRNGEAVASEMDRVRNQIGPIRVIIHGAGVLEDRFIEDKDIDQFKKVYTTKVEGLQALLDATKDDALSHMVFFSSVAARMGNRGQSDYAMANEVLNKMALNQSLLRPQCKVTSINWGPWDGGMVTPALKRNFSKSNISLIPLDAGAQAMVDEMTQPLGDPVEVVIGGPLPGNRKDNIQIKPAEPELNLTCTRDVSIDRYPVLQSHQLDGRPVVPLALITEWLAHSALHAHPGLVLHGMDHLRLLSGITLDRQDRMISMLAGKANRNGQLYEVDVEISDGQNQARKRIHSTAKAILSERLPSPPVFKENGHFQSKKPNASIEEIYKDILFHGEDLHGIQEIIRISQEGISARLASAPPPDRWVNDPLRSRWIADPLILDSAFQMAIIWCNHHQGLVCLPSYAAVYRQYCQRFPAEGVSAVLEVNKCSDRKMVGDFTFLDTDKKVLAEIKGYEAIMDPSLRKAFKAA